MLARQIEELNIHTARSPLLRTKVNSITHDCPPLLSFLSCATPFLPPSFPPLPRLAEQLGQFYAYWHVNTDQAVEAFACEKM